MQILKIIRAVKAYMLMITMSVFVIALSLWVKFFTIVDNVSNVIPPQIMMCLQYKQNSSDGICRRIMRTGMCTSLCSASYVSGQHDTARIFC